MAAPIRIRIGASVDATAERAFDSIEKRSKKMGENVARNEQKAARQRLSEEEKLARAKEREAAKTARVQEREAQRAARAQAKEAANVTKTKEREAAKQTKAIERAAAQELKIEQRSNAQKMREEERLQRWRQNMRNRYWAQEVRKNQAQERMAARTREREIDRFATRTSHRATRFLTPNAPIGSMVARGVGGVVRGLGIDASVAGSVSRGVDLQKQAIALSNQSFMNGKSGPAGSRANPVELEEFARSQADQFKMDPAEVMASLQEFVGKTGDLATAKATLPGLLKISKATGSNPADVLESAGTTAAVVYKDLAGSLDEAGERAKFLFDVMNVGAGGGKLGTVEFKDLAAYGPKLAATAGQFGGDKANNLSEMFALAQMGLSGGAASAAQATTSVAAMVNTLKTPARRDQFESNKVKLEDEDGRFRAASEIIMDSIVAAGKDTAKFKTMWANVQGARSVEGLRQLYLEKGGGDAGLQAMKDRFREFGAGAAMSGGEIDESVRRSNQSSASKAQQFQNNLDRIVSTTADKLLPALEELSPAVLSFAEVLGKTATWAVENPKLAIAGAISLSIARAGIESALRAGIENTIKGAAGATGIGGMGGYSRGAGFGGGIGVAGNLAAGATIAAMGVTTLTVGMAYIDQLFNEAQENQKKALGADLGADSASREARALLASGDLQGAKKKVEEEIQQRREAMGRTRQVGSDTGGEQFMDSLVSALGLYDPKGRDEMLRQTLMQQADQQRRANELLSRINQTLEDTPPTPVPSPGGKATN